MRSLRSLLCLSALLAVVQPSVAHAQKTEAWQDSWFWGVYGGATSLRTAVASSRSPAIGMDWLITRTNFALRAFAEQSTFTSASTVTVASGTTRLVSIADLRRFGLAATMFTPTIGKFRPYVEAGWALNLIGTASDSSKTYATAAQRDSVDKAINNAKAAGKLFGSLGVMMMNDKFSPFAQYTIMPTKGAGSWLVNGDGMGGFLQIGVRYNFGSSIEKKW